MARPLVILCLLPLLTASIDLSALVASHHGATLTPELLQKVKSLFPSASFNFEKDSAKLEKLLASLKPAEGRLDPAMIELLSSVDSGSKRVTRHRHQQSASDDSEDRPKFSSKFRLTPPRSATTTTSTTEGPAAEKFIDPNIRNHRLFINDQEDSSSADSSSSSDIFRPSHGQERFENYENFTTIDQIEDLMADESYPSVVVAVPVATTQRVTRNSSSMDTTTSKSVSHHRRRRPSRPPLTTKPTSPVLRRPALMTTSTISSFEDFIPFESMESSHQGEIPNDDDDDFPLRHREPLNLGSTEKTAVFYPDDDNNNNYFSTSTEAMSDYSSTPHSFRPSPLDLSPPVYFVPGQDFYTTSLKHAGNNSPGNIKIVKTPKPKQRRRGSHHRRQHPNRASSTATSNNYQSPSNQWQQGGGGNLDSQPSRNSLAFIQPPKHFLTESQQPPVPPSFLDPKSDRILQGPLGTTYTYSGQHNSFPSSSATLANEHNNNNNQHGPYASASDLRFAELNPYASSTTGYLPLADQTNSAAAAGQNYFAPNPSPHQQQQQQQWQYINQPQAFAPGTNYYYANPSTSDQQAHDSAHYHHHHGGGGGHYHGGETSSWTSTFFILGGLVALSGVIAFLLPSFLANAAGSVGGKDVDKIGQEETDLWSEIKALYNDIVHIAKGDFQSFIQNGPGVGGGYKDDLPNIHYEEVDEDEMSSKNSTSKPTNDSASEEQDDDDDSPHSNAKPPQDQESSSSTSAGQDDDDFLVLEADDEVDENRVDARSRKSKKQTSVSTSTLNYNPTLPYTTTFRSTSGIPGTPGVNFANAFNQTLHAWEAVPLIRS